MTNLIAIDPGYSLSGQGCACARLVEGELTDAWFARPTAEAWRLAHEHNCGNPALDVVVWECPQPREGRGRRGTGAVATPAVLVQLTAAGATLAGLYAGAWGAARVIARTPSAWKGTLPKPVQHSDLWDMLTEHEQHILGGERTHNAILKAREAGALKRWPPGRNFYAASWLTHNLLDAVALAMTEIGRMSR